ncbi:beta-ketoacyl synthase N-terminal-like domain-containing protein [Amycolatopsis sp. cg5]|uniref:beta-ketoacyl synthase N-terminal-like domain-containing protein n=1 Tax=Amycolatopsis sp. cg5 TaxID=3238802 RepID=UPI0035268537
MKILSAAIAGPGEPAQVSGFVESPFNPLVYEVAAGCLGAYPADGARTAIVLASVAGDSVTTDLASKLLTEGQPHNALLFMQATSNAILGYVSKEFGITGPLLSVSTGDEPGSGPLDVASVLLADDELDQVLVIGVELTGNPRTAAAHRVLGTAAPAEHVAVALLVASVDAEPPGGGVPGLLALAQTSLKGELP